MSASSSPIRYAVVGLGSFAQMAVLPAFQHAKKNSKLVAFVSGDPAKQKVLGKRYGVSLHYSYDDYDTLLQSGAIDAVYIVLPNHLHKEFAVQTAEAGLHVLCEKPLAMSEKDCQVMIDSAERHSVKLMTAYRLHLEEATLKILSDVKKGKIGEPKYFSSTFSHQVRPGDIRALKNEGGGALWDLGVYCTNAARILFRSEPVEVFAMTANTDPKRFKGVDEIASVLMRFPGDRLAQFTASQGASDCSQYRIVGTRGNITGEPIYEYAEGSQFITTIGEKKTKTKTPKRDQVAAELVYFSDCILKNKDPEPSGREGLLDVRVIEALYRSAQIGRPVSLSPADKHDKLKRSQTINRPAHKDVTLVHAQSPER